MTNDDEDVLGIDLDAWQPPPPPAVADGVVARMRRENTAVTAQALPVEVPRRALGMRWWIAGGVTVAIAATTVITFALTRGPANTRGVSAGDRAAHIPLGPSSADVDANTVVSWRREGDRITAKQAGGAAAWRVGDDDTLTIETGLASIEATNASLRVEVKMLDSKQTIALSAMTAAAVAAVTIVVYEGAVKAGGTTIPPGTAYEITAKGKHVIEEDVVALDNESAEMFARIKVLEAELAQKQAALEAVRRGLPADSDKETIVFADKRDDFAPNPFGKPPTCDAENLRQKGQELYSFGRVGEALGMFEAALKCAPGDVTLLRYTLASACKAKRLDKARLYWNKMNAAAQNPLESLCAANGLMRADLEGQPTARGRLRITNARAAKVFLDGRLIGTTGTGTPIDRQVAPGKHKIMFAIGDDKYTFSVLVKVGETLVVDKKLE